MDDLNANLTAELMTIAKSTKVTQEELRKCLTDAGVSQSI